MKRNFISEEWTVLQGIPHIDYRCGIHRFSSLPSQFIDGFLPLVWCPKRKPVLVGKVKEWLEQIIRQVAEEIRIRVLELAINPDHVHLFISAYPTIPVS